MIFLRKSNGNINYIYEIYPLASYFPGCSVLVQEVAMKPHQCKPTATLFPAVLIDVSLACRYPKGFKSEELEGHAIPPLHPAQQLENVLF